MKTLVIKTAAIFFLLGSFSQISAEKLADKDYKGYEAAKFYFLTEGARERPILLEDWMTDIHLFVNTTAEPSGFNHRTPKHHAYKHRIDRPARFMKAYEEDIILEPWITDPAFFLNSGTE